MRDHGLVLIGVVVGFAASAPALAQVEVAVDANSFAVVADACELWGRASETETTGAPQGVRDLLDRLCAVEDWSEVAAWTRPQATTHTFAIRRWASSFCRDGERHQDPWIAYCVPFGAAPTTSVWGQPSGQRSEIPVAVPDFGEAIADTLTLGLASFLVHRAEAELERWATDRLRTILRCSDASPAPDAPAHYLRHTCGYLGTSESAIGASFGRGLLSSLELDLMALPRLVAEHLGAGHAAAVPLRLVSSLLDSSSIADIASRLGTDEFMAGIPAPTTARTDEDVAAHQRAALTRLTQVLRFVHRAQQAGHRTEGRAVRALLTEIGVQASAERQWEAAVVALASASRTLATHQGSPSARMTEVVAVVRAVTRLMELGGFQVSELNTVVAAFEAAASNDLAGYLAGISGLIRAAAPALFPGEVLRVVAVAADLAGAQDPADVERAIDLVAAPPGGWEAQQRYTMWAVRGIVGGAVAVDVALGREGTFFNAAPVIVPTIGFTFPTGGGDALGYWGLDLLLIDLGSVATFADGTLVVDNAVTPVSVDGLRLLSFGGAIRSQLIGPLTVGAFFTIRPAGMRVEETDMAGMTRSGTHSTVSVGAFLALDLVLHSSRM